MSLTRQDFSSANAFERALVEAASKGHLVLTATARLARKVLHRYRLDRIEEREQGWKTPAVSSLNRWVMNTFNLLWNPSRPLSRLTSLRLWNEAVQKANLPEGLRPGPLLCMKLQEAFDLLTRHLQEVAGSPRGQTLPDWRREVSKHYLDLLEANRLIGWTDLLNKVREAVAEERVKLSQRIIVAGFDELYPAEETFIHTLSERGEVVLCQPAGSPGNHPKVRVFATPEQECQSVCAEVIGEWNRGEKRLGILFLDRDYSTLLKRCLDELADREARTADSLRYNLTVGTSLSEHPLFQTAIIPLRFLNEPEPNSLLSSFLCSPYVRKQREGWDLGIRRSLWIAMESRDGRAMLHEGLKRLKGEGYPVESLRPFTFERRRPIQTCLEDLERLWQVFGFPVCRSETDTLAKEHLFSILDGLAKEAGEVEVGRGDVMAWLAAACQGIEVLEKTPETAGIQVLNLVESRGLAFNHVWVVGVHGRVLPQPRRDLPFLDPDERRRVHGGTSEGLWKDAQRSLSYLFASAPQVDFSRALSKSEDAPYLPCPLIPDEEQHGKLTRSIDLWREPPQEWLRARWLRDGWRGLQGEAREGRTRTEDRVNANVPRQLDVTDLEDLLSCPFKFFASRLLALEPLEETPVGIDPKERGVVIHGILREFVIGLSTAVPDWPEDSGEALAYLTKTADRVLSEKPDDPFWRVERLRLLGDDRSEGLLTAWLEKERERAREGWRFETAEERFEGLPLADTGVSVRGRVDRVDSHPEGRALWDYKAGQVPPAKEVLEFMVRPQLPAYLLSLKKGLLRCRYDQGKRLETGYITLRKASEVDVKPLKDSRKEIDWEDFFARWEKRIQERLAGSLLGHFAADPIPRPTPRDEGACKYCSYIDLCGLEARPPDQEDQASEESPE